VNIWAADQSTPPANRHIWQGHDADHSIWVIAGLSTINPQTHALTNNRKPAQFLRLCSCWHAHLSPPATLERPLLFPSAGVLKRRNHCRSQPPRPPALVLHLLPLNRHLHRARPTLLHGRGMGQGGRLLLVLGKEATASC